MKFKKTLSAILAAVTLLGLSAGCGKKQEGDGVVVWYIPGATLTNKAAVEEKINEMVADKIGARVQLEQIDTASYSQKMGMMLASGDDTFDMMFVGYLNQYDKNVKDETAAPLTELINEYAPELWDAVPDYAWADAKRDGEVYAVPNIQIMATTYCYGIQTKYAEKYGWTKDSIESPEELEEFMAAVKAGENNDQLYMYRPNYGTTMWTAPKYEDLGSSMCVDKYGDSKTVLSSYEVPELKQGVETLRKWYELGYIRPDVASVGDDNADFQAGKYVINQFTWKPGMELQYPDYTFVKVGEAFMGKGAALSTMLGINHNAKDKEAAIKFISLLNTDKELYNLVTIGIEGVNYTLDENGKYEEIKDSGYAVTAWMAGNQFNALVNVRQSDTVWEETQAVNDNSMKTKLGEFTFDKEPVEVEAANIGPVTAQYNAMGNGSQPVTYWDEMIGKLKDVGIDRIKAEMQTQLDAYWANR